MISCIDKTSAIEIARQFLNQHFSIQGIDAVLEGKTWLVIAQIVVFDNMMTESIRVDVDTGKIIDYTLRKTTM
jgi:hypothetical protein